VEEQGAPVEWGERVKALTLWRPWPWAFFYPPAELRKRLENRTWPLPKSMLGQRVAFHAGKYWDAAGAKYIAAQMPAATSTAGQVDQGIIGTVKLVGCVHKEDLFQDAPPSGMPDGQARWFFGPYAFVTDAECLLPKPIPCKGSQGFWTVPPEIEAEIRAQGAA